METLPSGLPEYVGDEEKLARFLTQSNYFNQIAVKGVAFLPNSKNGETSVFRQTGDDNSRLLEIGKEHIAGGRNLHGIATIVANQIRAALLDIVAKEPPARHANIIDWPCDPDPEMQKAKRRDLANQIAQHAGLLIC